ncbi:MAG: tetratricopeptide repeat protein, partial [Kofleriaceae bacterium]
PPPSAPIAALSEVSQSSARALKTGMRRTRSRLQLVVWVLVGAVMIGGGVFAGFQIRAMRLGKQINAARQQAVALAKADTWQGWVGARDRLAGIAQAEDSLDNRAALARARAVLAFEFGDGLAEARTGVTQLAGKGGLDGELAAAYLALAQGDGAAARAAADRALALAPEDASALYVAGQAALLAGDARTAITQLKAALGKEQRAAHAVGLARALAMTSAWDDALGALEQALRATPDHPGALVERGKLLAEAGRIAPGAKEGGELRVQLEKVVHEGSRPVAEQTRGVSPLQVALAYLALARVDFARADPNHQSDLKNALGVGIDDQWFGEEATETFLATGQVAAAGSLAQESLVKWPSSRRARMVVAQVAIAQGKPADALEALSKIGELDKFAPGLAARAQAKLAAGDLEAAKADFDAALHRSPKLEPALVGRAWIDLAAKEVEEARQRIEPHWRPGASSPALATAYAAILRATQDPASRDQARGILERVVAGAPSATVARAQLELARLHREVGDMRLARTAYEEASRGGAREARLETGLLQIEDRDPGGGRDTIDQLVKEAGDRATPALLLEAARARRLAGDHAGAVQLLDALDKQPNLVRWQYDRERGRLALRRGDLAGATQALTRALDGCEDDAETFLLAAEAAGADPAQAALADKLRQLAPKRLKGRSEASIVVAKLALAEGNNDDADKAYATAKTAQEKEHATPRRQAQVNFGRAVIWYNTKEDKRALSDLDLAISQDPSIYDAYLFKAELLREKDPKRAFELAGTAVAYNPDYLAGWEMFGTLAHGLKKRSELATAVARVGELAPNSEALRQLQSLR